MLLGDDVLVSPGGDCKELFVVPDMELLWLLADEFRLIILDADTNNGGDAADDAIIKLDILGYEIFFVVLQFDVFICSNFGLIK